MTDQDGTGTQEQAADSAANAQATAKKKEGFSWNRFPGMIGAIREEIKKACEKILNMVSDTFHHLIDQIDESIDQRVKTQSEIADYRHSETTDRMERLEGLLIETTEKISDLESQLATSQATLKETNLTIDQLRETSLRGALTAVNELKEEFTQQISGVSAKQEDLILRVLQDEKEIKEKIEETETRITDWVQIHTSEKVSGAVDRVLEAIHSTEIGLLSKLETLTQKHGNLVERFLGSEGKIKESIKDLENRARQEVERIDGRVSENRRYAIETLEDLGSKIDELTGKVEQIDGQVEGICDKYALSATLDSFKESVLGTLAEASESYQTFASQTKEDHEKAVGELLALRGSWTDEEVQAMRTSLDEMRSDGRMTETLGKILDAGNSMMEELKTAIDNQLAKAEEKLLEVAEGMFASFKGDCEQMISRQDEVFAAKTGLQDGLAKSLKDSLEANFNQFRGDFRTRLSEVEDKLQTVTENLEFHKEGLSARVKTIDDQTATAVNDLRIEIDKISSGLKGLEKEFPEGWKDSTDRKLETIEEIIRKHEESILEIGRLILEAKKEIHNLIEGTTNDFKAAYGVIDNLRGYLEKALEDFLSKQDQINQQLEFKISEARAAALTLFKSLEPLAQSIKDLESATKKEMGENKAEMAQQVENAKNDLANQTLLAKDGLAQQLADAKKETAGQFGSLEQDIRQLLTATTDKLAEFAVLYDHLSGLLEKKHEAVARLNFIENMNTAGFEKVSELKVPEDWTPSGKNIVKEGEIVIDELIENELKTLTEVRKYIPELIFARKDWDGTNRMAFTFLVKLENKWYSVA